MKIIERPFLDKEIFETFALWCKLCIFTSYIILCIYICTNHFYQGGLKNIKIRILSLITNAYMSLESLFYLCLYQLHGALLTWKKNKCLSPSTQKGARIREEELIELTGQRKESFKYHYNGAIFHRRKPHIPVRGRNTKNGEEVWRCSFRCSAARPCRMEIRRVDGHLMISNDRTHNHDIEPESLEIINMIDELKKKAIEFMELHPQRIIEKISTRLVLLLYVILYTYNYIHT